jgi:hypothetical protein
MVVEKEFSLVGMTAYWKEMKAAELSADKSVYSKGI